MKSTLILLLTLVLVVAMTACTPRDSGNNSSFSTPTSSMAPSSSKSMTSSIEEEISSAVSDVETPLEDEPSTTTMSTDFDKMGALENAAVP